MTSALILSIGGERALTFHPSCTSYTFLMIDNCRDRRQSCLPHLPQGSRKYPLDRVCVRNRADACSRRRECSLPYRHRPCPLGCLHLQLHPRLLPGHRRSWSLSSCPGAVAAVEIEHRRTQGWIHRSKPLLELEIGRLGLGGRECR